MSITYRIDGGIWYDPFQFTFSGETQAVSMVISAHKKRCWQGTKQVIPYPKDCSLETALTHGIEHAYSGSIPSLHPSLDHFLHSFVS
jgi:hypothetical protein